MVPPLEIDAESLLKETTVGRSKAIFIRGSSTSGNFDCVVKLAARLDTPPIEYLREWVSTAIGQRLGIAVARPFQVQVTQAFAESLRLTNPSLAGVALRSLGLAYGSKVIEAGVTQWATNIELTPEASDEMVPLQVFDAFIHNVDRRVGNPNLFVGRRRLVAFDHADALAFDQPNLLGIDPATDPVQNLLERHVLSPRLRKNFPEPAGLAASLQAALSDEFFDELVEATPAAWQVARAAGLLAKIVDLLRRRRDAAPDWLTRVHAWHHR